MTVEDAAKPLLLDAMMTAVTCGLVAWFGEAGDEIAISSVARLVSNAPGRIELLVWRIESFAVSTAVVT